MTNVKKKRIMGIDPGTNVLGYAILDVHRKKLIVRAMGVLKMKRLSSHSEKLKHIHQKVSRIIDNYKPDEMAVESPFYGKNPQSMLKLGRAQGVAIAAAMIQNLQVEEYSPKKIKLAITGNGNASKEQVAAMLPHLCEMGDNSSDYLDASDALSAAICHHFQGSSSAASGKSYKDWGSFLKANPEREMNQK